VPVDPAGDEDGRICEHFGHCERFLMIDADPGSRIISHVAELVPPKHERGVLPMWLHEQSVNVVLTGGMGWRAADMLRQRGIQVITGVTAGTAREAVLAHLTGTLTVADNTCDH
jgi:predicted Fe-Mo cluster-binding NifX family protein